ncbi:MAG: hypothetical protein ACYTGZ_15035, partial [Planctomycetota bacterium]|jgi:predicted Zn-ribbon and HTH transcriptional regulator
MSVAEIAHLYKAKPRDIAEDIQHLQRSLKRDGYRLLIEPAHCRKCEFVFHADKLLKPSRCPRCRGSWIAEPRVRVAAVDVRRCNS